jgi:RNA polymerase sigma-70 factor (ECF subfamily)
LQQPVRCFRSYLLGIAKHQLFDHLRSEQRKQRRDADLETLVIDDTVTNPEAWVCAKREKRVLLHALRRLALPIQLVLELRYWERLSDREIAEVLELPIGTVKTRIATGRGELRAAILRLDASPERLQSTLDSLESWASRTQAVAAGAEPDKPLPR